MPTRSRLLTRYDRHATAMNRLLARLDQFDAAQLRRTPPQGGWSALQTVHHLLAAETAALQSVQKKLALGKSYAPAGLKHAWRAVLLNVALYLPVKFKAPDLVRGEDMPENRSLPELKQQAQSLQQEWRNFLETMPEAWVSWAVFRHPRAGALSWGGTFSFFRQHRIRHTRQILRAATA